MIAAKQKAEAESLFKPTQLQEEKPGRRTHAVMEDLSDRELERRLDELRNEQLRRTEAKREELEEGARHEYEKDKEDAIRLIKKIHDHGGCRDAFVEFASKANGAFSPDLLFERGLPAAYLPEELRPEGATVIRRSRTGRGGAASALAEKAPEKGAAGETQTEIIVRVVNEKKGQEMELKDIVYEISKDEIFGEYLKKEPKGLSRKIGAVSRQGLIKRVGKNVYTAA